MNFQTGLTEFDKQHACRGHGSLAVGGLALEVARVGRVQVADAESRPVRHGAVGDAPRLLHHGGVVLQPAHHGQRVARHSAEELGGVAQGRGDVVHGGFQADEEGIWEADKR